MNVTVLGTQQTPGGMLGPADAVRFEIVTVAQVPAALDSFGKHKFDVSDKEAYGNGKETSCMRVFVRRPCGPYRIFVLWHSHFNLT